MADLKGYIKGALKLALGLIVLNFILGLIEKYGNTKIVTRAVYDPALLIFPGSPPPSA